jgi:alpha-tubulin suppressor-like RCC1 family protein
MYEDFDPTDYFGFQFGARSITGSVNARIAPDGKCQVFGPNDYDLLGSAISSPEPSPTLFRDDIITFGHAYNGNYGWSFYLDTDGTYHAVGINNGGQFASGSFGPPTSPETLVFAPTSTCPFPISQLKYACCDHSSVFLLSDSGELYMAGGDQYSGSNQTGTAAYRLNTFTAVAFGVASASLGSLNSLYVTNSGRLMACGLNASGCLGLGSLAVVAGFTETMTGVKKAQCVKTLNAPAGSDIPPVYRWSESASSVWADMAVTTQLDDGSVGDASTGEGATAVTIEDGVFLCEEYSAVATFHAQVRMGSPRNLTAYSFKSSISSSATVGDTCAEPLDGPIIPTDSGATWTVYASNDNTTWTSVASGSFPYATNPETITITGSISTTGSTSARLVINHTRYDIGLNNTITSNVTVTDFRVTPSGTSGSATPFSNSCSLLLKTNGEMYWAGKNSSRISGDETEAEDYVTSEWEQVLGLPADVVDFEMNDVGAIALDSTGNLWGWGYGGSNPVGTANTLEAEPLIVLPVKGWTSIISLGAGANAFWVIYDNGMVYTAGNRDKIGQPGAGFFTSWKPMQWDGPVPIESSFLGLRGRGGRIGENPVGKLVITEV